MRDAGIIGFVPRGQYSPTETYDFLHFVYYGDSTYVAKKETTGNSPAENNEYWQLLAKGRAVGVTGVKGNAETAYRTGDVNITAGNVGALSVSGGILSSQDETILSLKRSTNGDVFIEFENSSGVSRKAGFNIFHELVATNKEGTVKKVLLSGDALPVSGGEISGNTNPMLSLKRITDGGSASFKLIPSNGKKGGILFQSNYRESGNQFLVIRQNELNENLNLFLVSETQRMIYDYKTDSLKEILVNEAPTVKETKLAFNNPNNGLRIVGYINNVETDIEAIFYKAIGNNPEGMIFGVSSNRTGYIIAQNFTINCANLTSSEMSIIKSCSRIEIIRDNNSVNFPTLLPSVWDNNYRFTLTNANGVHDTFVKTTFVSNSEINKIILYLPNLFRNDTNSGNNLKLATTSWQPYFGVNIKKY